MLSRLLNAAVLGLAVLAPMMLGACDRQSSDKAQPAASATAEPLSGSIDRSHKGSLLPEFTLRDASGNKLRLQALKGKPLLVNLWATWCAPCVVEMPMLDALAKARGGEIRVLTVSQDMNQTDKVAGFMTQRGFKHLAPWLDPENDLAFHYKAETLPATIYYDAQGREVWRYIGGQDWSGAGAAKMLAEGPGGLGQFPCPEPAYPELVDGRFFFFALGAQPQEQGRPFDKLREDGFLNCPFFKPSPPDRPPVR